MKKTSLDKSKIRILLLEGVHQNAIDTFKAAGYDNIESISSALSESELKAKIADAHFVGIRSRTQLTKDVFAVAEKLVAVGCFCIGTNQVDLNAAREQGIVVFNAPHSTHARLLSWCLRKPLCCCEVFLKRTRRLIKGSGSKALQALSRHVAKQWVSSAMAPSVRSYRCYPNP